MAKREEKGKEKSPWTQWTLILKYWCFRYLLIEDRREGSVNLRCSDRLATHPCCWSRRLLSKDIWSSPLRFLPSPPLLLLCVHISHSHGINHTAGPGQHRHTQTQTHTHHFTTPVEHRCQTEKKGNVFIRFPLYADRVLVHWIGKGALDNEASVITAPLQPLTTSIHRDQIKAFNCFASY